MRNSLQEQLLKVGLVSEKQQGKSPTHHKKSKASRDSKRRELHSGLPVKPHTSAQQKSHSPHSALSPCVTPQPTTPSPARDKLPVEELNRQIRILLKEHRQNDDTGEAPFYFPREGRIKKLFVTEEQRTKLIAGELAVAGYQRRHHVIPVSVAEKILALREEIFIFRADLNSPENENIAPEHAIPDDLIW